MTTANAADPRVVMPLRRQGSRSPLFCVHAGSGFGLPYLSLLPHVGEQTPLYALQARGIAAPAPLPSTLDDLVSDYLTQVRLAQPDGPYRLLGWCVGGRVAFEIASRLRAEGAAVATLLLVGAFPPDGSSPPDRATALRNMLSLPGTDDPELDALCRTPADFAAVSAHLIRTAHPMRRLKPAMLAAVLDVYANNERLYRTPLHTTYEGDVLAVTAADDTGTGEMWQPYVTGTVTAHRTTARHDEMFDADRVTELGALIDQALDRADTKEDEGCRN